MLASCALRVCGQGPVQNHTQAAIPAVCSSAERGFGPARNFVVGQDDMCEVSRDLASLSLSLSLSQNWYCQEQQLLQTANLMATDLSEGHKAAGHLHMHVAKTTEQGQMLTGVEMTGLICEAMRNTVRKPIAKHSSVYAHKYQHSSWRQAQISTTNTAAALNSAAVKTSSSRVRSRYLPPHVLITNYATAAAQPHN